MSKSPFHIWRGLGVEAAAIPDALKALDRWVCWKAVPHYAEDGSLKKVDKVPLDVNRSGLEPGEWRHAKSTDPATWCDFQTAYGAFDEGVGDGVGVTLDEGLGLWGLDFDHVANGETGEIDGELLEAIKRLGTYAELSPSGTGVRVLGRGKLPDGYKATQTLQFWNKGRFLTLTGHRLFDFPIREPDPAALEAILQRYAERKAAGPGSNGHHVDLGALGLSEHSIKLIREGKPHGERSEGLFGALKDLARVHCTDAQVVAILTDPANGIAEKVSEKGDPAAWLAPQIEKARLEVQREKPGDKAKPEPESASDYEWPEPADPFARVVVPTFPLDCLPRAYAAYARAHAEQSGFDAGAYGFCLLVAAGNAIDHRSRLAVTTAFRVPPVLWGGLVDPSGGGKTPVLNAAGEPSRSLNGEMVRASMAELEDWKALEPDEQNATERPPWRQRLALDTTIEALGDLLKDNPEGVSIHADELTEWIGRMDAYSKGGGKDRATYLRAFDGGAVTINRRSGHLYVDNFSVGILAGVQPEKLVDLYRRNGGGADGLYQRFLLYNMAPAGEADYLAEINPFLGVDLLVQFRELWCQRIDTRLDDEARELANDYHNAMRTLAIRTPGARFTEHLNKYPGFINRVAFALHVMEAASGLHGAQEALSVETWERAKAIMACLYRHSEAAYRRLDEDAGEAAALVRSAAEAILAKGWQRFTRSDLTRNATGWRAGDHRVTEGAIDLLIELGWLLDVTVVMQGRRGRRSDGVWLVNPSVHTQFAEHAERIRETRAERHAAIEAAGMARADR